jgi:hypothetical protein
MTNVTTNQVAYFGHGANQSMLGEIGYRITFRLQAASTISQIIIMML